MKRQVFKLSKAQHVDRQSEAEQLLSPTTPEYLQFNRNLLPRKGTENILGLSNTRIKTYSDS